MDNKKCGRPHCKNVEYRIDGYCSIYCRDVHDLETALEAAQAELAEAKDVRDGWKDYSILYKSYAKKWSKDNADLRKQLAEAQETIKFRAWRDGAGSDYITNATLRKQLAASIELCNIREEQIGELLKESEASQAEVERLRNEKNYWRTLARDRLHDTP